NKPFVILLNCVAPKSPKSRELRDTLEERYSVPVLPVNCMELEENDIAEILSKILYEFPVKEVALGIPGWIMNLEKGHWLREAVYSQVRAIAPELHHLTGVEKTIGGLCDCEYIDGASVSDINLGTGSVRCRVDISHSLFYRILGEATGLAIEDEESLLPCMVELAKTKAKYDKIAGALEEVSATGYGIVMPSLEELSLEQPEIVKQGGRYGVRLRASAPSIHIVCIKKKLRSEQGTWGWRQAA
ncbi:MAG: stage IV sporulation protein A, partial [Angelakisella sp.]